MIAEMININYKQISLIIGDVVLCLYAKNVTLFFCRI